MLIDIHTHTLCHDPEVKEIQVMDSTLPSGLAFPSSKYFCYGLHPWHVDEVDHDNFFDRLKSFVQRPGFFALGEVGLDRSRTENFELQMEVLKRQLDFAKRFRIPRIVFHCVRAYSDIIPLMKDFHPSTKFLFHDFNGNKETVEQLLRAGDCYFSFGARLFDSNSTAVKTINDIERERIFFETDDQPDKTIKDIYALGAQLLDLAPNELETQLLRNFDNFCLQ